MTMQGWAGDCIALLNHLGIASAHVTGHSFGAGIALQMAIDAPGRVRKQDHIVGMGGSTEGSTGPGYGFGLGFAVRLQDAFGWSAGSKGDATCGWRVRHRIFSRSEGAVGYRQYDAWCLGSPAKSPSVQEHRLWRDGWVGAQLEREA